MCIESVMPSNHLTLCCPLLYLPSILPSIRVFSNELVLWIMRPKYWSLTFSTSPSNEYSGLISFRMDWFDLLAVQGTLKSLLQQHSSKASILRRSAFFIDQLYRLKIQGPKQKSLFLSPWNVCRYTALDGHGLLLSASLLASCFLLSLGCDSQPYSPTWWLELHHPINIPGKMQKSGIKNMDSGEPTAMFKGWKVPWNMSAFISLVKTQSQGHI